MTPEKVVMRPLTWKSFIAGIASLLSVMALTAWALTEFIVPKVLEAARVERRSEMAAFVENPPRNFVVRDDLALALDGIRTSQSDVTARLARIEQRLNETPQPGK